MQVLAGGGVLLVAGWWMWERWSRGDSDDENDYECDESGRRRHIKHEAGI